MGWFRSKPSRAARTRRRRIQFEALEERRVLTAWHNAALPEDVDNNGVVAARDVGVLINEIELRNFADGQGRLPEDRPDGAFFYDVRNEGTVAGSGAIRIVNKLIEDNSGSNTVDPDPTDNEFFISQNAASNALVGKINPSTTVNDDTTYEFVKDESLPENISEALRLNPDDHYIGAADAEVLVIEYVDFACPVCGLFHPLSQQSLEDFDGDVAYVTRHLPLSSIHPNATQAAVAAEAAGRQGMFDEMADLLFTRRISTGWDQLADPSGTFRGFAQELGLDLAQYETDVNDPALEQRVMRDRNEAVNVLGLQGTPTFIFNDQLSQISTVTQQRLNELIQSSLDAVDVPFTVDRFTGEIRVRNDVTLDFDGTRSYNFDVLVNGTVENITVNVTQS